MKRLILVLAALAVVAALVALPAGEAEAAQGGSESLLGKVVGRWSKLGKLIEIRRLRQKDGNAAELTILMDGEVRMYRLKGGAERMECAREYDLEKIKKLSADAGWAHKKVLDYTVDEGMRGVLRALTIQETEDGKLEYIGHLYGFPGNYVKSLRLSTDPWEVVGEVHVSPEPCDASIVWGTPLEEGAEDEGAQEEKEEPEGSEAGEKEEPKEKAEEEEPEEEPGDAGPYAPDWVE